MQETKQKEIREKFIEYTQYVKCDEDVKNLITVSADWWLKEFTTLLQEEREKINHLKKIHNMELDAISCKSLEDIIIWSSNRKDIINQLENK